MSWSESMIVITRQLVNDAGATSTYSDDRLEELLATAAILVMMEVDFATTYTITLSSPYVTPDPNTDMNFIALVSLKAACLILMGEWNTAAGKAMSVRDGPSAIDSTGIAKNKQVVSQTVCKQYTDAVFSYAYGDGSVGQAIVGPYASGSASVPESFFS